jgi:hypothetical protein
MTEEKTVVAGAEPADTTVKAGAEPVKDAKSDSSTENVPWNKDPRFQDFMKEKKSLTAANEKLQAILKANDLDDPDDLMELVQSGKAVKGRVDVNQLDEMIQKAMKLDKYEAYWKDQEERKRREVEDPDQTIARLEKALKTKDQTDRYNAEQRQQAERAKQAINSYEREVSNLIKEMEIPKEQQGFTLEFFGVGNPANDIDITDRKAIKKLITEGLKKKESYDQAIIKNYLAGKTEIPKLASSAGAATEEKKPKIMLKDARKIFLETMQKASGG